MTKEALRRCRGLMLEAKHLRDMLACLNAAATAPRTSQVSDMPHAPQSSADAIPAAVERIWELEAKYYTKLSAALVEVSKVEAAIEKLEPTLRVLVRMHYIQGLTWEATAEAMNYSVQHIHRLHSNALILLKSEEESK